MPVRKDASGRRSVEMVVEVPGTPEAVWRAVATGPGSSAWFTDTVIEEREGGRIGFSFGAGMTSGGRVTTWQPPRRFGYEEIGWSGDAPPLATEIVIEGRSGGTCVLRMVHSLLTERDDWDAELGNIEKGWPPYFGILRLYLQDHAGQPAAGFQVDGRHPEGAGAAWRDFTRALGLHGLSAGAAFAAGGPGAPPLAGTVHASIEPETGGHAEQLGVTLRLERPATGLALLGAFEWGGRTHLTARLYLYGAGAAAAVAAAKPAWAAWMAERFPIGEA